VFYHKVSLLVRLSLANVNARLSTVVLFSMEFGMANYQVCQLSVPAVHKKSYFEIERGLFNMKLGEVWIDLGSVILPYIRVKS